MRSSSCGDGVTLVVDDDVSCRALICETLQRAGLPTTEAADGAAALEVLRRERPIAVVLDVELPRMCGYEVCRAIRLEDAELPVLFVSGEQTRALDRVAGLTIGADDYLVKPFAPDELVARLRVVLRRARRATASANGLTAREREVLTLLAEGLTQAAIADRLVISRKTVGTHIERILCKLGVHSRAEAVAAAYRLSLVAVPA